MLDCIGSMYYFLDAAKARISAFVKAVGETYPDIPLRIGFTGYRDIRDGPNRLVLLPFQKDLADFERQLASMSSFGGGAPLTDLTGALKVVSEQVLVHPRTVPHRRLSLPRSAVPRGLV